MGSLVEGTVRAFAVGDGRPIGGVDTILCGYCDILVYGGAGGRLVLPPGKGVAGYSVHGRRPGIAVRRALYNGFCQFAGGRALIADHISDRDPCVGVIAEIGVKRGVCRDRLRGGRYVRGAVIHCGPAVEFIAGRGNGRGNAGWIPEIVN